MNFLLIIPHYISWHYTKALRDLIELFKNLVTFIWNLFSINILFKTLFVPFQKLSAKRTKGFDLEDFFSVLVTNLLMRFVGFLIRSMFIVMGLFLLAVFVMGFAVFFLLWMILPLILLSMISLGLVALFKAQKI